MAHPPCHVDHQSKTNKMINLCLITQSPITSHHTPQSPPRFPITLHHLIIPRVNRSHPRKVFTPQPPLKSSFPNLSFFLSFLNKQQLLQVSTTTIHDLFNPQLQTTFSYINTHTSTLYSLYIYKTETTNGVSRSRNVFRVFH